MVNRYPVFFLTVSQLKKSGGLNNPTFYFLNNFCQIMFYFDTFWHTADTWMNLQQNSDKIIHLS